MRVLLTVAALVLLATPAAPADGTRVANERYKFAFTFEPDTELTYEPDGVGVIGTHLPSGARKPDYGVLVYGGPGLHLSAAEAQATGLGESPAILNAADVLDPADWPELYEAIMAARGLVPAGQVRIAAGDGTLSLPFYVWEQHVLGRTHHALMYVAKHGDAFIYVQVESDAPLTDAQLEWMTTELELQ